MAKSKALKSLRFLQIINRNTNAFTPTTKILVRGFTLIEILVAVFIFSVVVIGATTAVSTTLSSQAKTTSTRNVTQAAQDVIEKMTKDIHEADKISLATDVIKCSATPDSILIIEKSNSPKVCYCKDNATVDNSDYCDFSGSHKSELVDSNLVKVTSFGFSLDNANSSNLELSQRVIINLTLTQTADAVRAVEEASIRLDTSVMKMRY